MSEELAAQVHKVYCLEYQKRFGKPYWTDGDYTKLDEPTKDYDRAFVRWHLAQTDALRAKLERAKKEADNAVGLALAQRQELERVKGGLLFGVVKEQEANLVAARKRIEELEAQAAQMRGALERIHRGESVIRGLAPHFIGHAQQIAAQALALAFPQAVRGAGEGVGGGASRGKSLHQ